MPLSPVYPHGTPLDRVRTHDGEAPFATHTHIYLDGRTGPDDPTIRRAAGYAVSDLLQSKTRDALLPGATRPPSQGGSTPGIKQRRSLGDEDDPLASAPPGTVVAKLPPPPDDMHYEVQQTEQGHVVVLEAGPPINHYTQDRRIGDRLHAPPGGDPRLRRQNIANRRFWRGETRDADTIERTVFVHRVNPDERIELSGPDANGFYTVTLISPPSDITWPPPPLGAGPEANSGPSRPSRTGDQRAKLRQMNAAAKRLWARKS